MTRIVTVVLGMLLFPALLRAQEKPIVAVFDIEDQGAGLSQKTLERLSNYLGTLLAERGYQVVPRSQLKERLLQEKKESYKACYDEACQIEIGKELAAQKTLASQVIKLGKRCTVTLTLYDLKRAASERAGTAEGGCDEDGVVESIKDAVGKLAGASSAGLSEEDLGARPAGGFDVGAVGQVIVQFESEPSGAVVMVDGRMVCKETPCSKSVPAGVRLVAMQAERYDKKEERVELAKGKKISWWLSPNYGWLTVKSEPAGLEVKINGRLAGRTPLVRVEQDPGLYEVLIESPCYYPAGKRVELKKGEEKEVSVAPAPREGAVEVTARDKKGNDLEAEVYIDGVKVGETPGRFKAMVCAKELEVRHPQEGSKKLSLSIEERKVAQLEVILEGDRVGLMWIYSKPAGIEFTKSEITVAQYRECVEAGMCTEPNSKSDSKYCNWGYTDRDNHPVNCVDWYQAKAFCEWVGGRLPTEE